MLHSVVVFLSACSELCLVLNSGNVYQEKVEMKICLFGASSRGDRKTVNVRNAKSYRMLEGINTIGKSSVQGHWGTI